MPHISLSHAATQTQPEEAEQSTEEQPTESISITDKTPSAAMQTQSDEADQSIEEQPTEPISTNIPTTDTTPSAATLTQHEQTGINLRQTKEYICICGYNAKNKSHRLKNHQKQYCKMMKKSVPVHPCPICGKQFSYDGLKSHLLAFTKTERGGTYKEEHATVSKDDHKKILEEVKSKYGPKKIKIPN